MPPYASRPSVGSKDVLIVDLNNVDSDGTDSVSTTERPIVVVKPSREGCKVATFLRRNRVDCGKARLQCAMPSFYLNQHELPGVVCDQIGFKERCPPVSSYNVESVAL